MMFEQRVTRLRAPVERDRYRNEVRTWAQATRLVVDHVNVQPTGQAEAQLTGDRDTVTTGWRVYGAEGVDVDVVSTDRVELADGTVCEVVGDVARWPDPLGGGLHHVEFSLQRITG